MLLLLNSTQVSLTAMIRMIKEGFKVLLTIRSLAITEISSTIESSCAEVAAAN